MLRSAFHATEVTEPADIDPVGLWYRARQVDGIDDCMWFGFFDAAGNPRWTTLNHRHYDGIGALAVLFAARGWRVESLPQGRDRQAPSWWARRRISLARAPAPRWRSIDPARSAESVPQPPTAVLLDAGATAAVDAAARHAGVSSTSWLLWTADRAARELIAEQDTTLSWVFPVNLRGAVQAARPTMNHCSGLTVQLDAGTTPPDLHRSTSAQLARGEHWRLWDGLAIGRWIGARGVALLYRLVRAPAGRHAGSYSNLGDWPPPGFVPPPGDDGIHGLVGVAPGSPAFPISAATQRWRGRRTLACRLHPVIGRPGLAEAFVARWQALALGADPQPAAATPQTRPL